MAPQRRHQDDPVLPHRRREDRLEEMLEHGSENFRRYRRRAYAGFAALAAASAFAIWLSDHNAAEGRRQVAVAAELTARRLATATAQADYSACLSGNRVRTGIVTYLDLVLETNRQRRRVLAREVFALRNCREAIEPLEAAAP